MDTIEEDYSKWIKSVSDRYHMLSYRYVKLCMCAWHDNSSKTVLGDKEDWTSRSQAEKEKEKEEEYAQCIRRNFFE